MFCFKNCKGVVEYDESLRRLRMCITHIKEFIPLDENQKKKVYDSISNYTKTLSEVGDSIEKDSVRLLVAIYLKELTLLIASNSNPKYSISFLKTQTFVYFIFKFKYFDKYYENFHKLMKGIKFLENRYYEIKDDYLITDMKKDLKELFSEFPEFYCDFEDHIPGDLKQNIWDGDILSIVKSSI